MIMITEEETTGISRATLYKYVNLRKENQNSDAEALFRYASDPAGTHNEVELRTLEEGSGIRWRLIPAICVLT